MCIQLVWSREERLVLWRFLLQAVKEHPFPSCFLVEPLAPRSGYYPKRVYLDYIMVALRDESHFSVFEAVERECEKWQEVRARLG